MLWLFREEEFYIAQVHRLSGSFEYPTTAAAYFAISLPVMWWSSFPRLFKWPAAILLWSSLILTVSRGAVAAVAAILIVGGVLSLKKNGEWQNAAQLLVAGVAACVLVLPLNPYVLDVFLRGASGRLLDAQFKGPWNSLRQQPGEHDEILLNIRNTGTIKWLAEGRGRIALSYRWIDSDSRNFVKTPRLVTTLQRDVQPGETVDVQVAFETPEAPGKYILAFELFGHDFDWFNNVNVAPYLVEGDIQPGVTRHVGSADLSSWYRLRERRGVGSATVPRSALWSAAMMMFLKHPFGVGPDNFRLEFGKYLGVTLWDTRIHSNNLYLEILTGSGVLGLAAFVFLLSSISWRLEATSFAIGIFLAHGCVDVFLMATPIYFAFWILVGTSSNKLLPFVS